MCSNASESCQCPTKQRILQCAEAVFADKGFQKATIAEICDAADANIAAVNYHFGNKSKLYTIVLENAYTQAQSQFPTHGNLHEEASPEDRMEAFIRSMILRAFCTSSASAFSRFIVHEMTNPTDLLESVMMPLMHNDIKTLREILKPILPEEIEDWRRRFFGFNIIGIVMFFSFNKPACEKMMHDRHLTTEQVDSLIQHITLFILHGLKSAHQSLDIPFQMLHHPSHPDSKSSHEHLCCDKQTG